MNIIRIHELFQQTMTLLDVTEGDAFFIRNFLKILPDDTKI